MKKKMSLIVIGLLCVSIMPFVLRSSRASLDALSVFPSRPPRIDGLVAENEWNNCPHIELEHGLMLVQNDAANLYLLIDLSADTHDDPPLADPPWGDYFWLSFDVNIDGAITPRTDVAYSIYPGTHNLGKCYYLGPGETTVLGDTHSQLGAGFGPSINSRTPHRIWELAISLPEIKAVPNGLVRIGLRTYSQNPRFTDDHPENFDYDFSNLMEIALVTAKVDLLVLADEDFCDALKPLKEHKDYTGINTYVQSWQSLDKSCYGWDEPERVKRGIAYYEKYCDTRYVMLVGDCDRFPVRYCKIYDPVHWGHNFPPSDLYYADLYKSDGSFDDWDGGNPPYGGNGIYGEMNGIPWQDGMTLEDINLDRVNLTTDVAVGRVPASTVGEVTTYVNKVISYEFAAYKSDWSQRALMAVPGYYDNETDKYYDYPGSWKCKEHVVFNLTSVGVASIRLYDQRIDDLPTGLSDGNPDPWRMNEELNRGVGFVNFAGHGSASSWGGCYDVNWLVGGFGSSLKWHDYFCTGQNIPGVGDFDGDGKDDMVAFNRDTGAVRVALSTGSIFGSSLKWHLDFCTGEQVPA
ncbi:MAG: C25 family cysteine peptidase, partial [Candidatus Hermodarchaeota archaeon]|nr:C25 family cysteine peptidase [Candidatus Hermodarchaeota archaeon]